MTRHCTLNNTTKKENKLNFYFIFHSGVNYYEFWKHLTFIINYGIKLFHCLGLKKKTYIHMLIVSTQVSFQKNMT